MNKIIAVLLFIFVTSGLFSQNYPVNFHNLEEWNAFSPTVSNSVAPCELFSITKNSINCVGKKAGYIISKESFKNFKLTLKFRWNTDTTVERKSNQLNNGIMYLVPDTAINKLWPTGTQFQIKEGHTGDFIFLGGVTAKINGKSTTAGRSEVYNKIREAEKEIGKWNKVEITVKDGNVIQKLNGKLVNQASDLSVSTGRILFMYEGYPIQYQKIKIKRL